MTPPLHSKSPQTSCGFVLAVVFFPSTKRERRRESRRRSLSPSPRLPEGEDAGGAVRGEQSEQEVALAQRIEASRPVAIMTASCGIEGAKKPTEYKSMIEGAVHKSSFKPFKTIVWQREQLRWDPIVKEEGQRNWQRLVKSAKNRGLKADAVPVQSGDGLYIIYTSGTTGLPKGVVRSAGGHAVGLNFSIKYLFGVHGPGDVMFTASDIGWVVGHSYIVYAPLLAGAATVLYEGKPVGTPDASSFWRVVEEYKVNTMFTAPTALRAIRREDPDNDFISEVGRNKGLKSLRALFLAGERSEPAIITMYQELISKYGAENATVIDNWWSSESGSPITGLPLIPSSCQDFTQVQYTKPLPIKPGSAGKPAPGNDVRIVDDEGKELPQGSMGNIVLAMPLSPTALLRRMSPRLPLAPALFPSRKSSESRMILHMQ